MKQRAKKVYCKSVRGNLAVCLQILKVAHGSILPSYYTSKGIRDIHAILYAKEALSLMPERMTIEFTKKERFPFNKQG